MPINYSYDPTGSRLTTDNDSQLRAFLSGFQYSTPPPAAGGGGNAGRVTRIEGPNQTMGAGGDLNRRLMAAKVAEAEAQAKIAKASSEPIQKKIIGGPGVIPGYVPDYTLGPRALMPQNGNIMGGGGSGPGGQSIANGGGAAADYQRYIAEMKQRGMRMG